MSHTKKRIIVACDGTGQSAIRGDHSIPTNVTRLCRALSNTTRSHVQQIVFYQSGVGTQDLGTGLGSLYQGAIGTGLEENVADGYSFIMNNYLPGDELFIFGFSRGAFTARVLANIIARHGIIAKSHAWAFKDMMKAYKDGQPFVSNKRKPNEKWGPENGDLTPRVYEVEIEVVGCWDTVASLGLTINGGVSTKYQYFDGSLVKGIKHAFHALALDECRGPFTPTLWYLPKGHDVEKSFDLRQCWFPGAHSNVGGGYPDRALANLTLAWMIEQCKPFLDFDSNYINRIAGLDRRPEEWQKDREDRKEKSDKGEFDIQYQGYGRGMLYDSYKQGDTWTWKYRTPGAYAGGVTNETLHVSVRERWQTSEVDGLRTGPAVWKPKALKGFQPRQVGDKWDWVKNGAGLSIPEAPFPTEEFTEGLPNFEWLLRHGSSD